MTTGTVKTQGSALYLVDRSVTASDPDLIKLDCPTGVQGLGGAKDQIEITCLDTIGDKEFAAGLGNPGQVTVPFNFIPSAFSHQNLLAYKESGETLDWILCLSESSEPPTLDTDLLIVPPTTRSSFQFQGYVADVNFDLATNEIVRGTLLIQRSGNVTLTPYIPA